MWLHAHCDREERAKGPRRMIRSDLDSEESPDSIGQITGEIPAGATPGKVQQRADRRWPSGTGKGETVVQETTSDSGDRIGLVNPDRSKAK